MAIHVTEIGRHRFICGLFWQSLSRRHELRKEAAGLGRQLKFDLMVLRIDRGAATAGFANREDGARVGMSSLGAMVSKAIAMEGAYYDGRQQPAPNWLGAFKLPDGLWAYFAVRDGLFLPNGDWAASREQVLDRLQADYSLGGWNAVIGEPEIEAHGYHNFYPRRIDDLLPQRNGKTRIYRWWGLQTVRRTLPRPVVIGAAGAGLALAVGGTWLYIAHQRELASEREAALRVQRDMHRAAPQPLPHPWARQPLPNAFTQTCMNAFSAVSAGGWTLDQYVCTPQSVTYSWVRNNSTVAFLLAKQPGAQVDAAGNRASLQMPLPIASGSDEQLGPDAMRTNLMNLFQTLGRDAKLQPVREVVQPRSNTMTQLGMEDPPPQPDWHTWTLDVNLGGLSPLRVAALLEQPGVRIGKLVYHGGEWSLQGEVYVR